MTVDAFSIPVRYSTNGTTGPWTIPFYFLAETHVLVIHASSSGIETELAYPADFAVTGAGSPSGGTVTTTDAYATGGTLTIDLDVPIEQQTDYAETDSFPAASHERALDKLTMIARQLLRLIGRAPLLDQSTALENILFPSPGAGKFIRWNLLGDALEAVSAVTDIGSFIQSGVGAVARVATAKMGERFSVEDFYTGAPSDFTSTIRNAIEQLHSLGGGTLHFQNGKDYQCSSKIEITGISNVHLVGNGARVKSRLSLLENTITFLDCSDCTITGFKFDGGLSVTGFSNQVISMRNPVRCGVSKCSFTDYGQAAVLFFTDDRGASRESADNWIEGCYADGGGVANHGFLMEGQYRGIMQSLYAVNIGGTAPGFALNFKNICDSCEMIACWAIDSLKGIICTSDVNGDGNVNCRISATAINCGNGYITGSSTGHVHDIVIDAKGNDAPEDPADPAQYLIAAHCGPGEHRVSMRNCDPVAGIAIGCRSDDQTIDVSTYDDSALTFMELEIGTERCRTLLRRLETGSETLNIQSKIIDSSGVTTNQFSYLGDFQQRSGGIHGTSTAIYMPVEGGLRTDNQLRFDNTAQFAVRTAGTDRVVVDTVGTQVRTLALADGVTAPSAATGLAQIFVSSVDGDLKVIFGDGTVKTIVTDT